MRVATWNVERLKYRKSLDKILSAMEDVQADILVLTETDERIAPNFRYAFHTPKLIDAPDDFRMPGRYSEYAVNKCYAPTENRVSIYTSYPCVKQHETYDKYTTLCVEINTPYGNLLVYGTIMGIIGNRDESFKRDVISQTDDFARLSKVGSLCICGDYNCSFADNYYFTKFGRDILNSTFETNGISLVTGNQPECIDHIAVSQNFIGNNNVNVSEWSLDKKLSDHKGIVADLFCNGDASS